MNEFTEMIKEAFVGAEPYDPSPGREALRASILKFERRDRVVRLLSWFMVTFMSVVAFWAAWSFWAAGPDVSLSRDAVFLGRLAELNGEGWLINEFEESVEAYESAIEAGRIEPEYRERHADTLQAIGDAAISGDTKLVLRALARRLD